MCVSRLSNTGLTHTAQCPFCARPLSVRVRPSGYFRGRLLRGVCSLSGTSRRSWNRRNLWTWCSAWVISLSHCTRDPSTGYGLRATVGGMLVHRVYPRYLSVLASTLRHLLIILSSSTLSVARVTTDNYDGSGAVAVGGAAAGQASVHVLLGVPEPISKRCCEASSSFWVLRLRSSTGPSCWMRSMARSLQTFLFMCGWQVLFFP